MSRERRTFSRAQSRRTSRPWPGSGWKAKGCMSPYITIAEAAELARESPATLYRRLSDGTLTEGVHFVRPRGKHPLIKRDEFVRWIEERQKPREPCPGWAHGVLRRAILCGELSRGGACSKCGAVKDIQGHHEDYSRPLDVVWLCRRCHSQKHVALGMHKNRSLINWIAVERSVNEFEAEV
jgi:excisionase family DNA binding protein